MSILSATPVIAKSVPDSPAYVPCDCAEFSPFPCPLCGGSGWIEVEPYTAADLEWHADAADHGDWWLGDDPTEIERYTISALDHFFRDVDPEDYRALGREEGGAR